MARMEIKAVCVRKRTISKRGYFGYDDHSNLYIFEDEAGNNYAWFTCTVGKYKGMSGKEADHFVQEGDSVIMTATVGEEEETKYGKQRKISRPTFVGKTFPVYKPPVLTMIDKGEAVKGETVEMPYRQYKEHYSDCTSFGFDRKNGIATIKVFIPEGRLKASGVRGERLAYFYFKMKDGSYVWAKGFQESATKKRVEKLVGTEIENRIDGLEYDQAVARGCKHISLAN